jgi:MYXO-CTERM domain-containing protein
MRRTQVAVLWVGGSLFVASGLTGCAEPSRAPADPVVTVRAAAFINGDLEADAINATPPTGWTISSFINPSITDLRPNPQTLASLNLATGGYLATHVVGGATESQPDPDLGLGASLRFPKYGLRSAVVNYQSAANPGNLQNVNQLTQTMITTNSDVDSSDNKVHVRFAIAPVLFSGGHPYNQQPYYYVELDNLTKGTTLYRDFNASAQAGVPWKTDGANTQVFYTDWSLVDIAPGNSGLAVGDQVKLVVIAGGCSAGGHFGRVYVDGIGSAIPGIYTSATGPASANTGSNITYVVSYKNGGTATAAATVLSTVIPTGTTFQATSLPSACSGVTVGATGTLSCSLGALAAGSSGSFTITVNITGPAGTPITNGNYSIRATGVTALLGPKVLTAVTSGVTYADVVVTKTDGVAAVGWGQAVTYSVVASNAGPGVATSVTIADTMPAQFTGATWTCAGTGGGTCTPTSGTGNLSGTTSLPVGATVTYTIQGAIVAGTGTGSVTNTATATLAGATDPDLTNNSGVDTDSIGVLRTLTVTKTNSNGGSVTSVPASIACGTSCASATGSFVDGTSVVLAASPVSGASFTAWGGACTGSAATCTLTITGDVSVTAAFTPPPTVNLATGNNQGAALNTAFATTLTVRVLDSAGNPLSGRTVLLTVPSTGASATLTSTSVTTDASGFTPPVTATANGTAGAYLVTAALSGTPTTGTFSLWNYGAATSVNVVSGSGQSVTVGAAFPLALTVVVHDAASQPVPGVTVTFAAPGSGARATLSPLSGTTNASGQTSVSATAGTVAGGYSVTATATGVVTPATFTLTNAVGAAASIAATSGSPQSALLSTAFAAPLVVTVRDSNNNVVPGVLVTFTVPLSGASASLAAASGTTNASGLVSLAATANGTIGVYAVTAAATGVATPATFSLTNFGTLALAPATITRAPRASATFVATGDPAASYIFTLLTNASGGSINAASGVYTAGVTGGVSDVVRVMDSMSRTATATVTVGPAVSISPSPTTSAPRGGKTFTAIGGSGAGFVFTLSTNASSGSIVAGTGVYTAGATGSVTDVVRATDSLGNFATATIAVGAGITLTPVAPSTTPRGAVTLVASGGSGTGYVYVVTTNLSGAAVDSSGHYTAGTTGGVSDVVTVTDSLGNTASRSIIVGGAIVLVGSGATTPPRGSRTFSASGGSGAGFVYSFTTNASGGTIDPNTGAYVAGSTGSVTDVVKVTDSLGNIATANMGVGVGVSLSPATPTVAPRGSVTLVATGGSGSAFVFTLTTNLSGGSVNPSTGVYTAGATGAVVDVVRATDSLGNIATASISVSGAIDLTPATAAAPPSGTVTFVATGGSGSGYVYAITTNLSGGTIDPSGHYTAGNIGGVTDVVTVTDSLGNTASRSVSVGAAVTLVGSGTTSPPRGPLTFSASGGSGTGFVYSFSVNASGGTIDTGTGAYTAGSGPSVVDIIQVVDSLGNIAAANVAVGVGVSLSPASPSVAPRGLLTLLATGGSGTGFVFAITTNASGGSVDGSTGAYTAGATGATVDLVSATDSLGNSASVAISIGSGLAINPNAPTLAPRQSQTFATSGGSGTGLTFAISTNGSGGTINATTGVYTAGATGNSTDLVTATDSLGNSATATVHVGTGLVVTPNALSLAPLGTHGFSVSGGSGSGYRFTLSTNASGGSIDASTGAYTAGPVGGVTDTVLVTDSLGNTSAEPVIVTAALTATASTLTLPPRGGTTLTVTGGAGGNTLTLTVNGSGATLDPLTGAYVAGGTGNTGDLVTITDVNGATITIAITIGPGVTLNPGAPSVAPRGPLSFNATGGSGTGYQYTFTSNNSGGSVDAATGAYLAGATSNLTDVVTATDSLGNSASVSVSVGGGLTLNPATPTLAPRATVTLTASGGSGTGYGFVITGNLSGASIDSATGAYQAGIVPNVTDGVTVTDSLGNTAVATIMVGAGVAVAPAVSTAAPRGTVVLSASGGSGTGYIFAVTTNNSGATIDASAGRYVAGTQAAATDTVTVTDSLGNTATATVTLGAGLSLLAPSVATPPRGAIALSASGGAGGYTFSVRHNGSGANIVSTTGLYTAGPTPSTTDLVEVTDEVGNSSTVMITVGAGVSLMPSSPVTTPGGPLAFTAAGGSGVGYVYSFSTNGSGGTVDSATGAYVAGGTDDTSDVIGVVDSLGNMASVTVAIGAGVSLNPPTSNVAPRATVQLTAAGGSGAGYAFTLFINASGGAIDAQTGLYHAGTVPNVTDVVKVVDSLGSAASAMVTVGAGIRIGAATASVAPMGAIPVSASGGSGTGYHFTITSNGSGATIDGSSGDYRAGTGGPSTDVVTVTDALGNSVSVTITVGAGLSVASAERAVAPRGTLPLTASGGAPSYSFTISTNHSGGSISPSTGDYTAGSSPNVQDVVTITDANGATQTVTINVGTGVSITPTDPKVAPKGIVQLTASGGSGIGFTWRVVENGAGGSVAAETGEYTGGATPPSASVDLVEVTDSLGNTARVTIHATVVVVSASGGSRGCACATAGGGATPGLPAAMFALLAVTLITRRRSRRR